MITFYSLMLQYDDGEDEAEPTAIARVTGKYGTGENVVNVSVI